jgi:hypothetical protein
MEGDKVADGGRRLGLKPAFETFFSAVSISDPTSGQAHPARKAVNCISKSRPIVLEVLFYRKRTMDYFIRFW